MGTITTRRVLTAAVCGLALTAAPAPATAAPAALPAYFLDHDGTTARDPQGRPAPRLRLFREHVPAATALRTVEDRAEAAANAVMAQAGQRGHVNAWGERVATDVDVQTRQIVVTLDGASRQVDPATARMAVSSVVWTVTATAGKDVPVTFRSRDGQVLGGIRAGGTHRRSTGVARTTELAAVWVDAPARGAVLSARRPVTVSGTACAFEGTVAYRLTRGTTTVRRGVTTATIACPTRGSWTVPLGTLRAGTYRFEAWAPSPREGEAHLGRVVRTFTVR